jgi:hypothetical protein
MRGRAQADRRAFCKTQCDRKAGGAVAARFLFAQVQKSARASSGILDAGFLQ